MDIETLCELRNSLLKLQSIAGSGDLELTEKEISNQLEVVEFNIEHYNDDSG